MEHLLTTRETIKDEIIQLILAKELDYSFFSVDNVDLDTASDCMINKLLSLKVKELVYVNEDIYNKELEQ